MKKHPIVLIGGGGHAQSVIDVLESQAKYEIMFIYDQKLSDSDVLGYPVVKHPDDAADILVECQRVVIAIGQIKNPTIRIDLFHKIKSRGGILPNIISPHAHISKHACLGQGNVVMHSVIINSSVCIGNNCIINSGATIEHGVKVEDHSHISTQAVLNGNCSIGWGTFVGSNATITEEVIIANNNVIGAGAVLFKDTVAGATYVGNPARLIEAK